jgi:hypothetical protein
MKNSKGFLEELAERIIVEFPGNMDQLCIIFPNRRAGLFFNKALARLIREPIWSPAILSIEDFILRFSDYTVADRMTLLLDLYEVYREGNPIRETFDNFYFWGEILLKDFDEVDKYLVNAGDLFVSLKNLKEIDTRFHFFSEEQKEAMESFWSAALGKPTENKKNFVVFWNSLNSIYLNFVRKLKSGKYGYQGLIYRHVWEKMKTNQISWGNEQVLFAGFNALTLVEENIIKWVIQEKNGRIYWDLDAYYFDDPLHEAGLFLRKYYHDPVFKPSFSKTIPSHFKDPEKEILSISAAQYPGQAKIAGNIVSDLMDQQPDAGLEDTVIVLPDESLLTLLLYTLPDRIQKFNITMGYPVVNSTFYSLFEHLLELQEKTRRGSEKNWFNHGNVIDILNHPYIMNIDPEKGRRIVQMIQRNNMIHVPADLFADAAELREIFKVVVHPGDLFDYLMNTLIRIRSHLSPGESNDLLFEKESALVLYKFFNRLKATFISRDIELGFSLIRKVIRSYARHEKIPFTGEPLEGLQIMGLMETRNLDFRNVIMTGVNEGFIPRTASPSSFIPHNVRRAFGLPVPENQDAIYSYLFYRLVQRAEKIFLIYNAEDAYNRKAEPSRYIYQLKFESELPVDTQSLVNNISIQSRSSIEIRKDEFIMRKLGRYLVNLQDDIKFLTPSKLSMYLGCPLSFCYRYVYDVDEKQEVTEDLDAAKFGRILHKVMEYLYLPYKGRMLNSEIFREIGQGIREAITHGFAVYHGLEYQAEEFRFEGKNLLGREIIRKYVKKILEYDQSQAPFEIRELEVPCQVYYPVELGGKERLVAMRGVIDRVDMKDGTLRIIDYKSGRDLSTFGSVPELFEPSGKNKNKAVFQTFLYALMYLWNHREEDMPVVTGLYNFKELHAAHFDIRIKLKKQRNLPAQPVEDIRPMMEEFKSCLSQLIKEIFDPSVPFRHPEETKECF